MNKKKKIGQRIWELFLKNYSYSQIAKILNIHKSVISNVINYSLPPGDWCNENIPKLKDELIEKKRRIKNLKEEKEDLEEQMSNTIIITLITLSIYIIVTAIILYFVKINFYKNLFFAIGFIIYSIVFIVAAFFATVYIKYRE